jgi:polysaccharide export outer membrane protein
MTTVSPGARHAARPAFPTDENYKMSLSRVIFALLLSSLAGLTVADETTGIPRTAYHLQPGDLIEVSVWKETDLQREILIRPDGAFTFPLAGEVETTGKSVEDVRATLAERLKRFVPSPVVTVAVKSIGGNRIYVLGKVNHAGEFPFSNALDVMQAISLAGGATPFAALNDIVILRRENGRQKAFNFHYSDVARGRNLPQNIQLQSGDTVVVP